MWNWRRVDGWVRGDRLADVWLISGCGVTRRCWVDGSIKVGNARHVLPKPLLHELQSRF